MAFMADFGTGWEHGAIPTQAGELTDTYSYSVSATNPHSGSYKLTSFSTSGRYCRSLPTARSDLYMSIWVYGTAYSRVQFRSSDTNVIELRRDADGYWDAYVNNSKVADGSIAVNHGVWHRLSCHIVVSDSGTIATKIDGIDDLSYSGDTLVSSYSTIDAIRLYGDTGWDDFVVGSGGWPGDWRFAGLTVNSDVVAAWTPSTGTDNYACVDEVPASDTDYVSITSDATDQYGCSDFDDDSGNRVPGLVMAWAKVKKSDAGTDDKITLGLSDGVNNDDGSAQSVLTTYEYRYLAKNTAPDGGAWTDTDVDNLEVRLIGDIV